MENRPLNMKLTGFIQKASICTGCINIWGIPSLTGNLEYSVY